MEAMSIKVTVALEMGLLIDKMSLVLGGSEAIVRRLRGLERTSLYRTTLVWVVTLITTAPSEPRAKVIKQEDRPWDSHKNMFCVTRY